MTHPDGPQSSPGGDLTGSPASGQQPYGAASYEQQAYGQQPYPQQAYGQPYGQVPYGQPYGQAPYGAPPPYGHPYAPQRTNGMAIASMVLGILWIYWIGSILALVFGYVARKQIRERGESGGGMATAGIVLGYVGLGVLALVLVFGIAAYGG